MSHNKHYVAYYPAGKGLFSVNKIMKQNRPFHLRFNAKQKGWL